MPFADAIERLGDSIQIPLPHDLLALDQKEEIRYALGAGAPAQVSVVGSFLLGSTLATSASGLGGTAVDLALEMPSSLFETKDYLNYRYTTKRAYYLAALAKALAEITNQKNSFFAGWSVAYEALEGDVRRPILVLSNGNMRSIANDGEEKGKKLKSIITLRLFPTPPSTLFTPRKLGPARNCLRKTGATAQLTQPPPTPQYNTGLLVDASLVKHLSYLHRLGQTCRAFKDAVLLGKVWLAQRKAPSSSQEGHFTGFLFSMVLGHLLSSVPGKTNKRLSTEFSAFQLFKGTLDFLGIFSKFLEMHFNSLNHFLSYSHSRLCC
jgi:U3 small nucleolar RNA-associated protein 22